MPSVSKKQEKFMRIAAHDKEFADKAGISQSVAQEFHQADKAKRELNYGEMVNGLRRYMGR